MTGNFTPGKRFGGPSGHASPIRTLTRSLNHSAWQFNRA